MRLIVFETDDENGIGVGVYPGVAGGTVTELELGKPSRGGDLNDPEDRRRFWTVTLPEKV